MVGLVDIAPALERVTVRGQEVEVSGVSALGVASLLARFPELRRFFAGREIDVDGMLVAGAGIVGAILAAGTGALNDEAAEEAASRLTIDEQADLLAAIVRLTLPGGLGPFVDKLQAVGAAVGVDIADEEASPTAPATKSPSRRKR